MRAIAKLKAFSPARTGVSEKGNWSVRTLVFKLVDPLAKYEEELVGTYFGEADDEVLKDLLARQVEMEIVVFFRAREVEGKWFSDPKITHIGVRI